MKLPEGRIALLNHSRDLIDFFSLEGRKQSIRPLKDTLTLLFREIKEASQAVQHLHFERTTHDKITKPTKFRDAHFHPKIIRHINTSFLARESVYVFSLFGREVHVFLSSQARMTIKDEERYVASVATWLYIAQKHAPKPCASRLAIYLYLTNLVKSLPSTPGTLLDEWHINTAFTTSCSQQSNAFKEIVVYRREEWFKVFVHETFHAFGLDFSGMASQVADRCVARLFPVQSMGRTYEAYTECWAEIWNTCFCAYYESATLATFLSNASLYLQAERSHTFFQLAKVLNHMGVSYSDLQEGTHDFQEGTSVFAYYVLKSVIWSNLSAFLGWCRENNGTSSLFAFRHTVKNQTAFCAYIHAHYQSRDMMQGLHEGNRLLRHLHSKPRSKGVAFLLSNLRMTVCELG